MMRDSLGLRFRILFARATGLFFRGKRERDLDGELRAHLQMLTEGNTRRGLTPEEAAQAARREFGGFEQTKEAYREQRGLPLLDTLVQDGRFARSEERRVGKERRCRVAPDHYKKNEH